MSMSRKNFNVLYSQILQIYMVLRSSWILVILFGDVTLLDS